MSDAFSVSPQLLLPMKIPATHISWLNLRMHVIIKKKKTLPGILFERMVKEKGLSSIFVGRKAFFFEQNESEVGSTPFYNTHYPIPLFSNSLKIVRVEDEFKIW